LTIDLKTAPTTLQKRSRGNLDKHFTLVRTIQDG